MALRRRARSEHSALFPGFGDVVEIGSGSLATVFRAREASTQRLVALKLLNVRDVSPRALESFQRESVALGALSSHPNIVTLFRTFSTDDGRPVLVLELCGGSVSDQIRGGVGMPVADAVGTAIKVAGALETAHRADILHRDVKPQNILITEFGEPALADFGVAMLQSSSETTAGLFDFTTLHAAPELLEGRATSAATDVYELASTLYQLIAGRSAFRAYDGESPASVILRILRDPVRPVAAADVPTALSDLLIWAMSKDKDSRPPSATEFAAELSRIEMANGWERTQFLVRDSVAAAALGAKPSVSRFPTSAPAAPTPAARPEYAAPEPAPAAPAASAAPPAPAAPPPPRVKAYAKALTGPTSETPSGELWSMCPQGHLVVASVKFCPVCGAAVVHQRPADVVSSEFLPPEPFRPLHIVPSRERDVVELDPRLDDLLDQDETPDPDEASAEAETAGRTSAHEDLAQSHPSTDPVEPPRESPRKPPSEIAPIPVADAAAPDRPTSQPAAPEPAAPEPPAPEPPAPEPPAERASSSDAGTNSAPGDSFGWQPPPEPRPVASLPPSPMATMASEPSLVPVPWLESRASVPVLVEDRIGSDNIGIDNPYADSRSMLVDDELAASPESSAPAEADRAADVAPASATASAPIERTLPSATSVEPLPAVDAVATPARLVLRCWALAVMSPIVLIALAIGGAALVAAAVILVVLDARSENPSVVLDVLAIAAALIVVVTVSLISRSSLVADATGLRARAMLFSTRLRWRQIVRFEPRPTAGEAADTEFGYLIARTAHREVALAATRRPVGELRQLLETLDRMRAAALESG